MVSSAYMLKEITRFFTGPNGATTIIGAIIVAVATTVLGWLFLNKESKKQIQKQKTGNGSVAIQSGGNTKISK